MAPANGSLVLAEIDAGRDPRGDPLSSGERDLRTAARSRSRNLSAASGRAPRKVSTAASGQLQIITLAPDAGERADEGDAGGSEVLGVVDHDGVEGRGRARDRRAGPRRGAPVPGVEAGPGIQGRGGFEIEHPEVVP